MNIVIVGTRRKNNVEDYLRLRTIALDYLKNGNVLISGGCPKGADRYAELLSVEFSLGLILHPAEWDKFGRGAGLLRNTDIAFESEVLIAMVSDDRTGGTEDTIKKFIYFHGEENLVVVE